MRRLSLQLILGLGVALLLPSLAAANPISDENALTGNSNWEKTQADTPNIDGYTSKTSVAPGETIGFNVSTSPAISFRIVIYRLGWYNGAGARQMTCLPACTGTGTGNVFSGVSRSTPAPNADTGKVDAGWPQTASLTIPANWTTGEYMAEYVPTSGSNNGRARYSPFVVRSSAPQAQASSLLVVVPFNTYLAYNEWGKVSAYDNFTNGSVFDLDHGTKVSFNRPFHRREWRFWDYNLVRFLEKEGYDVSYVSDTDVDADPSILLQHRAVIVSGHSEYWTKNMRDGFDAARDAGTNLFFAGANDAYWQVRYEDSSCAANDTICSSVGDRRTMVIYKEEGGDKEDPNTNPALETIQWRDLGRPECELQGGVQYGSWFPDDGYRDYTTTADGAADSWSTGTGLSSGSKVTGLVGFEYDSFFPNCDVPGTPRILFAYQGPENSAQFDSAAVKYTANGSGARVFSSGTEQWTWGLDSYRWDPTLYTGIPPTNSAVQQFTRNMLADMSRPSPPAALSATVSSGAVQIDTTPRGDPRVTSHKIYRHTGSGSFQPGDAGVTLVCQNASGDCSDSPAGGTYRYASVAVDQWNDSGATLSGAVTVSTPVTAVDDSAAVDEDSGANAIDVLANDTPSGATKTITARTQGAHGSVVITGGGSGLTYQPTANYCGSDSFTYTANGSSTGTVSVDVDCVDDPPAAVDDSATVAEDAAATSIAVLTNDTDIDGGTKSIASRTQASHGSVVITGGGSGLTYQPAANYCGADSFTYTLNGGDSGSVSVTVTCSDDPPSAVADSATVAEDATATAIPVLANDTDIDGGPKAVASVDPTGAHGTVTITGGGTGLTYRPNANYCNSAGPGPDTFTYALNGGDSATVSVTVTCVDDAPLAVADSAVVAGDSSANELDVLSNDADVDGGPRAVTGVTQPSHGTAAVAGGGTGVTYTPGAGYCGTDDFDYMLNGGDTATISVTVDCGQPPTAVGDSATVTQGSPPDLIDVLANDTDPDGGPKLIGLVTQPGGGSVVITQGGAAVTYEPHAGYCNSTPGMTLDRFDYTLNGGSTAAVTVTVTCAAGGVAGDSQIQPTPVAKKCKKKKANKAKAKCRKKKKKRSR